MLQRSFGRLVFATLQDGTGRIQLMADRSELPAEQLDAFAEPRRGRLGGSGGPDGDHPQGRAHSPHRALRVAGQGASTATREVAWPGPMSRCGADGGIST